MLQFMRILFGAALGLLLASVTALTVLNLTRRPAGPDPLQHPLLPDRNLAGLSIPPFDMLTHEGKPATRALLEGRVTIVSFIFTNCPLACPIMTSTVATLADRLRDTSVRFASFSLDPEHDSPEALTAFARQHGADLSRWTFLTDLPGGPSTTHAILRSNLKEHVEVTSNPIPLKSGAGTMNDIQHTTAIMLIGPGGELLGRYDSRSPEALANLEARARAAAALLPPRA